MAKYKIELNYDTYFEGEFQENESITHETCGRTKKEAIAKAVLSNKLAEKMTNDLFGFFGKLEIKNIKAKYKNKFVEVDKICGKQ